MTVTFGKQPQGKFVYKKQSKIRWRPSSNPGEDPLAGSIFVCGSWDDVNNEVSLWKCNRQEQSMEEDVEPTEQEGPVFEPDLLSSFNHDIGDVNDIHFLTSEVFAVASSDGTVTLVKIDRDSILGSRNTKSTGFKLAAIAKWSKLHSKQNVLGSCNAISCAGDNIVSAGSNGQMFVLNGKRQTPIKSFHEADSGSISSVLFLKQDQTASGNTRGQVKIWDLRANESSAASKTCHLAMDLVGVSCLAKHPTQPHVMVGGTANGVLAFWDLRGSITYPLSVVKAHTDSVSEVHFHDQQPDHLFSCSQTGEVWHWNGANQGTTRPGPGYFSQPQTQHTNCIWLNSEVVKTKVDTRAIMAKQPLPVNSISVAGSSVLVAGDSEAIFIIPDIGI